MHRETERHRDRTDKHSDTQTREDRQTEIHIHRTETQRERHTDIHQTMQTYRHREHIATLSAIHASRQTLPGRRKDTHNQTHRQAQTDTGSNKPDKETYRHTAGHTETERHTHTHRETQTQTQARQANR